MAVPQRFHNETAEAGFARTLSAVVGVVFLAVGILGFVPLANTGFDSLTFAGHHSETKLLGVFAISILHNLVHLLFGIAGMVLARRTATARLYLFGSAVIYLGLWLYGLIVPEDSAANFVPVNSADDWLHFGLGVSIGLFGLLTLPGREARI
jgi:hypothetical protein